MRKVQCGLLAATLLTAGAVLPAAGADTELLCTIGKFDPEGATMACYSDAGCAFAEQKGAEPVRDFDETSAPFALARGKIAGVVTSSAKLIAEIKKLGGSCKKI